MAPPFDVIAFGAAHIDTISRLHLPQTASSVPGETHTFAGGAAFNVARHMAAAGLRVALVTPSRDERVLASAAEVGLRLVAADRHGDRDPSYTAVLNERGDLVTACADMSAYDGLSTVGDAVGEYEDPTLLVADANLPAEGLRSISARFPSVPLAALAVSPTKVVRFVRMIDRLRVLFASHAEFAALRTAFARDDDCGQLERLSAVVTNGADAIDVRDQGRFHSVPVPFAPVIDVTGAGDALAAGTLVRLMRGNDLSCAVRRAVPLAQRMIGQRGPFSPFPELLNAEP